MVSPGSKRLQSKSSLLKAYQLLVEDLDYGAIEKCTDVAMLVMILRVLRSAEMGYYPHLIEFTEARIKLLSPRHVILSREENVWIRSDLDFDSRDLVQFEFPDLTCLNSAISTTEIPDMISCKDLDADRYPVRTQCFLDRENSSLTEIRCKKLGGSDTSSRHIAITPVDAKCRSKSSDFADWDKYDVNAELQKLDEQSSPDGEKIPETLPVSLRFQLKDDDLPPHERRSVALHEKDKRNEAYRAGDYQEAVTYFTRSLSILLSTIVLNNRAQANIKMKGSDETLSDLHAVLKVEPENVKALLRLSTVYLAQKDYILAETYAKCALEVSPDSKLAAGILGQISEIPASKAAKEPVWLHRAQRKGPLIEVIE